MTDIKKINDKIDALVKSERITKQMLGELSRDLLNYVLVDENHDIQPVNRTLRALTPMNRKVATLFFRAFMPFKYTEAKESFGTHTTEDCAG